MPSTSAMRSRWRANLSPDLGAAEASPPAVLIAALSGRALAACARRAGYTPLVADLFADLDTRAMSGACLRAPGTIGRGLSRSALPGVLDRLAAGRSPEGLVWGSGFEDRPALLETLAGRYPLLGNSADTVMSVKDPLWLADLCRRIDLAHPPVLQDHAQDGAGLDGEWLRKRAGAAGGGHVAAMRVTAMRRLRPGGRAYLQRRITGRTISTLFLADGRNALVLGFTEQWSDPAPLRPFRYGGAVRPAELELALRAGMERAVSRLVPLTGLIGLNSADFIVRPDGFTLIEINPRPGATLDVYAAGDGALFRHHVDACRGRLPSTLPVFRDAAAAATIYASRPLRVPPGFAWPEWAADRQPSDSTVAAGAPLCTVLAEACHASAARDLAALRRRAILKQIEGSA